MSLEAEQKRWEEQTRAPALERFHERKESFETSSGIPLPSILTPTDGDYLEPLGFPGEYPFTRGIHSS